ncbi:clusterin-like protein 1 [Rhinichthys klamathensis goyatoka]|uniref:clusterin-like protein 1 n=1 Tax=Rhinichthys klamathensis goyatoka TaxID=3034132 RepID=UPI0024B4BFEC|nr:clusterin-like protein 1 [Rhinichthys klamathensis goyatoka]XP_056123546.1 clusterin-like protein 1 [Rhinichthys klamathensis goyatoka]
MRALMVLLASLGVFHCAPGTTLPPISANTLKRLSLEGEKLVDQEVSKALYGIKEMKEVMASNEEKHANLMKSLMHNGEKKKGAAEIAQNVEKKLNEAEQQCKESLKSSWEECRPCLEDTCKNFYTNTCRRGFATFTNKLQNFFQRTSSRFGPRDAQDEVALNQSAENPDLEVVRIEDSFSNLLSKVGTLVNRSAVLVSHFHHELDQALRRAFSPELQGDKESELALKPANKALDSAFLEGVGLDDVLESFFDFGRNVLEEFGAVITQAFSDIHDAVEKTAKEEEKKLFPQFLQNRRLCRDLRRQSSECWQLQSKCEACQGTLFTECPNVRELHVELDEVSQLLEASKQQYEEVLGIAQRHTNDTISWLSNMASDFGWVTELANNNTTPESIFSIATVVAQTEESSNTPAAVTTVEVNILNSPTLTLTVPAALRLQDPAFIQYVAQEALGVYKQMARHEDV